jgi:hypothetical protein
MHLGLFTARNFGRISARRLRSRSAVAVIIVVIITLAIVGHGAETTAQSASAAGSRVATVHIDATPGHAIHSFDPDSALGSSVDVLSHDGIDKVYTPHIDLKASWPG